MPLHRPHPSLCSDKYLVDGHECLQKIQVPDGHIVTIAFECGDWAWVDTELSACKSADWFSRTSKACTYTGWIQRNQLNVLPVSKTDLDARRQSAEELLRTPLVTAIYHNDVPEALRLVQSGSQKDMDEALVQGVVANSIEIVRAAIAKGGKLDSDERRNCHTVISAAIAGPEVLDAILALGGDINCQVAQGVTPLIGLTMSDPAKGSYWSARGRPDFRYKPPVEMVKYLVKRGADLEIRNSFGETALGVSVKQNNVESAKALIALGANAKTINSWNPDQNSITLIGNAFTPFHLANDPTMLKLILSNGSDPNALNPGPYNRMCVNTSCPWSGQTALTRAIHDRRITLVKILLAYGADPRVRRADGKLPYDIAVKLRLSEIAALLQTEMKERLINKSQSKN